MVKKMTKKLLTLALTAIVLLGVFALGGCNEKASKYTEEEHIQRVTERIEKKLMTDKFEYTGFEVYPLYDENDDLKYFLIEFEPNEFVYVRINESYSAIGSLFGGIGSIYTLSDIGGKLPWRLYKIDEPIIKHHLIVTFFTMKLMRTENRFIIKKAHIALPI